MNRPTVMTIAGLDPSGGAGLVADIQAISALGAHPAAVATALTVQDTRNAYEVQAQAAEFVVAQARAVLEDIDVAAIKLGLLGSAETGRAVAALLADWPRIPVVLDPVLVASGGARLAEDALVGAMRETLFRHATVVTPNRREFTRLAASTQRDEVAAAALLECGCQSLLVTGGDDATDNVRNTLYRADAPAQSFEWPRFEGSFHGSGCTLSSAIAAHLAHGKGVVQAVSLAQDYTALALEHAEQPGRGQRIPHRMQ